MDIATYQEKARERIESGKMTQDEWDEVTVAIMWESENNGMPLFDANVDPQRENNEP